MTPAAPSRAPRAVVFAYHNVGARCLRVLLAHGVAVPLVVTHRDQPGEAIWFESVQAVAADYGLRAITPDDANAPAVLAEVAQATPDFLFSFYYRQMLGPALLALPPRGALNMHGSLLPRYRGRAPVNWAVLHGERHTGASLHYMVAKPDAGDLVAQTAVPILPDDTARDVFDKVTLAAEITLDRALPALIDGTAPRTPLDLGAGSYFGGRTAADGRIDWAQPARCIHDLVRAVAPPYPGAGTHIAGRPARILRTRVLDDAGAPTPPLLVLEDNRLVARCGGGGSLAVLALELDGTVADARRLADTFGPGPFPLGTSSAAAP